MDRAKVLGQDTYMEKHMFTKLKYELKHDDISKNREVAVKVKSDEAIQADRLRDFHQQ